MRHLTAGLSGLCLGIAVFFGFLGSGNLTLFQIIAAALVAFLGLIEPLSIIWDRFGGKPISQSTNPNTERDEKRYLGRRIKQFAKEAELFIPLRGELELVTAYHTETGIFDDIADVLQQHERFVLIGAPGAGKSTTLRHLWQVQAEQYLQDEFKEPLPLWVFLGRGDNPEDATELVSHWWTHEAFLPDDSGKRLKQDVVYLFFDGLNEMPDESREQRAQSLKTFLAEHPTTPVIVTCREHDYEDEKLQLGLPIVRVQPLDVDRITRFIDNRLGNQALWHAIKDNEALLALAHNPYNLTMLIEVFKGGALPQDLSNLYRLYVEITRKQYKAEKKVRLTWKRLQAALETLAFRMITRHKGTEADEEWCRKQIGRKAIRDGIDLGVLVVDEGTIRFYHHTLHHYFFLTELVNTLQPKWYDNRFIFAFQARFLMILPYIWWFGNVREIGVSTPMLVTALKHKNPYVRLVAAQLLGEIRDSQAIEPLIALLHDKDWDIQLAVVGALGQIGDRRAVEPLITALSDKHEDMRGKAAEALGQIGDKRAVEPLTAALHDEYLRVRYPAVEALGQMGEIAVDSLIVALNDMNADVREKATEALGQIGDKRAVESLITALHNEENEDVRRKAAKALGIIGDSRAVESLVVSLHDENIPVSLVAVDALGQIGESAVEPLIIALKDEHWDTQAFAADYLGQIGESAVEPLIIALRDVNEEVRSWTAEILGRIGDSRAVVPLIDAVKDQDLGVQQSAVRALGKIDNEQAVASLIAALQDEDLFVRVWAASALLRKGDRQGIEIILNTLHNEWWAVRLEAVKELKQIGDVWAVKSLIAVLNDENDRVRSEAAGALGKIGDSRAVEPLIAALNDEDYRTRSNAAWALKEINTPEALEAAQRFREGK
jgi:HEAT repeat protein